MRKKLIAILLRLDDDSILFYSSLASRIKIRADVESQNFANTSIRMLMSISEGRKAIKNKHF